MKSFVLAASLVALTAAPLFAQTDRVSVSAAGGFAVTSDATSGDALGEVAVRVAPHLSVFGDIGQFHNVQPSAVQPSVDTTTAFMMTVGGGVDIPVAHRWSVDAGYRFSRIAADTPMNVNGVTFGLGYRF